MKPIVLFILSILLFSAVSAQQSISPDNTSAAARQLNEWRQAALADSTSPIDDKLHQLIRLGLWEDVERLLKKSETATPALQFVKARFAFLQHEYKLAESLLTPLLEHTSAHPDYQLLQAQLAIQAWDLAGAQSIVDQLLAAHPDHELTLYQHGRLMILRKAYHEALSFAHTFQQQVPHSAKAHLLEAETHLWLRDKEAAETALQASLRLNPFDTDARFYYGYAIWRRVDATQLSDMALQWELALELNPLHFLTHWHWGNGHTHLTYQDYLDPQETEIDDALAPAEAFISQNKIQEALDFAEKIQEKYPNSVLPAMLQGSAWYMAYDIDEAIRLDESQAVFQGILGKKDHYGPAHNALAAVIKQKQIRYLGATDSLEQVIASTEISPSDQAAFLALFPDMTYYPGDRVQKMIWQQLHAGRVYIPFLNKLGRKFVIPPLHTDLATAMRNPYFRGNTTFDNRQWMDIRGVGSGATGIEYVERGAHLERNVTLHEYVHLFHMQVFTDWEKRRVRALYANAMKHDLTLDYYSANNEHEYLAQTYTAYFAPVKVHPLNHKAVNIKTELMEKDPRLYGFLDSLVHRQQAYLSGDDSAMASNWAQVYVNLADNGLRMGFASALTLARLDTSLMWDKAYLPAYLTYARALVRRHRFAQADSVLWKAIQMAPDYAPIYLTYAELSETAEFATAIDLERMQPIFSKYLSTEKEVMWLPEVFYRIAYALEQDDQEKAGIQEDLRTYLKEEGKYASAISLAESYAATASTYSTYLRDVKVSALAFAHSLRTEIGYVDSAIAFFEQTVPQYPQNYQLRLQYADAVAFTGDYERALDILLPAHRLLAATGNGRKDYATTIAFYQAKLGNESEAISYLEQGTGRRNRPFVGVETLIHLKKYEQAKTKLGRIKPESDIEQAKRDFCLGLIAEGEADFPSAISFYQEALSMHPYDMRSREKLIGLLKARGDKKEVKRQFKAIGKLPLAPGPAMMKRLEVYR